MLHQSRYSHNLRALKYIIAAILATAAPSIAAQKAVPAPSASPQASPAPAASGAQVWHNPPYTNLSIVDPCGGPKELLSKINPSPCVLIRGEAMLWGGYANVNAHGNVSVSGPQSAYELPVSGNANIYPGLAMAFGVSATSQFQITLPSDVDVATQRLGSASAATNTSLYYKQLLYFSQTKFTLAGVEVGYTAPTGNSLGPAYQIQPMIYQPLNANVGIGGTWTFKNAVTPAGFGETQRGWSDPILLYVSWSPQAGGFAFFPIVSHNFSPNQTTLLADAMQLFGRHFLLSVEYGGLGYSASATGPFNHGLSFAANANPRLFAVTMYYLMGESNLPPAPPAPAPSATP